MTDINQYLVEDEYVDFSDEGIQNKAAELFSETRDDIQKTQIAYEFVRDKISHSFDIKAEIITAKASNVLRYQTGICHAKANLMAALLRSQGIPVGFCFQRITLFDDDSKGYCVHCFNAVWLDERWIKLDARGNKSNIDAQFSMGEPKLAFPCRAEYEEFFWSGVYANPHSQTMCMLNHANSLEYVLENIPENI